ncbi:DUF7426 family protein [Saccharopolyspora sp. NPDC002376]
MTGLRDLSEVLDPGLSLPISGTTYTVPPPDAETGLRLQRLSDWMMTAAAAVQSGSDAPTPGEQLLSDSEELDLYRDSLGTAYDEMIADAVAWPWLKVAGMTAFTHWTVGAEQAQAIWEAGGRPEPSAGNRQARRADRSTPLPGSANGTSQKRKPKHKAATRGGKSSKTGR